MVRLTASRPAGDTCVPATEAAPNSYTGSGPAALPPLDGVPSPPGAHAARLANRARQRRGTRPRNLSVPHAGPAKRQARSPKGNGLGQADPRRLESGAGRGRPASVRIGSVRSWLGMWAASIHPVCLRPMLGPRRGGQSKVNGVGPGPQVSRQGSLSQDSLLTTMRSPLVPQLAVQLPAPGRACFQVLSSTVFLSGRACSR